MNFGLQQAKRMNHWIDEFNNTVVEATLLFEIAVSDFLEGRFESFEERNEKIAELEHENDNRRRHVEKEMYSNTLIPESRGDVLSILENSDEILTRIKVVMTQFSLERPEIPESLVPHFMAQARASRDTVEDLVRAIHGFFKGDNDVSSQVHKVYFYEREADRLCELLKRELFSSELDLAHKLQIDRFIDFIENVANAAEDVAERLAIYAIKRQI